MSNYNSTHTGAQLDEAIGAVLTGGSMYNRVTALESTSSTHTEQIAALYDEQVEEQYALTKKENYVKFIAGKYPAGSAGTIIESDEYSMTDFIPCTANRNYFIYVGDTQIQTALRRYYDANKSWLGTTWSSSAAYVVLVVHFVVLQKDTYAIESVTNVRYNFNKYEELLPASATKFQSDTKTNDELQADIDTKVSSDSLFDSFFPNMANPADFATGKRYSKARTKIQSNSDTTYIGGSGLIPVESGKTYTISGTGWYGLYNTDTSPQGGYFGASATGAIGDVAVSDMQFGSTPMGSAIRGYTFTVPNNPNIKFAYISIYLLDGVVAGNCMLNVGEVANEYVDYHEEKVIKEELLPNQEGGGGGGADITAWSLYSNPLTLAYHGISNKFPKFRQHWMAKDKDLMVVTTGTSLSSRVNYCSQFADAPYRPPLLDYKSWTAFVWDNIKWSGQQYRRFDAKVNTGSDTPMFTEVGTFATTNYLSNWDDYSSENAAAAPRVTRYSEDSNAAISCVVPLDAWQFNLIYRLDTLGSEHCTVTIAEGNGKVKVWNESNSAWVEANGFDFSMKNPATTSINISYTNPTTGAATTLNNCQVSGNTTYQKRLKFLLVDHNRVEGDPVTLTISNGSGRFMYWGVEWSNRRYMITYVNSARGSHSSLIGSSRTCLIHYQDNEIWGFNPDLIFAEDPIYNSGGGTRNLWSTSMPTTYFAQVSENFWCADNGVSMLSRCENLGLDEPELILFNAIVTTSNAGTDDKKELSLGKLKDNVEWTVLDAQMSIYQYFHTHHTDVVYINNVMHWYKAAIECYGNIYDATISGVWTYDGTHCNTNGHAVWGRCVAPVVDFGTNG